MAIIKQYLVWQPLWNGTNVAVHLAPQINNNWNYKRGKIKCTELSYGNVREEDSRYLAILEYDDSVFQEKHATRALDSLAPWVAREVTAAKALEYCNRWYPSGEDPAYFTLDVDGFTLIDGRPIEEEN